MNTPTISLEQLETALRRLPSKRYKEVLLFIEFLEHMTGDKQEDDADEDEDLWAAVSVHHAYRDSHPEEPPEIFDSADDFLRATADL